MELYHKIKLGLILVSSAYTIFCTYTLSIYKLLNIGHLMLGEL